MSEQDVITSHPAGPVTRAGLAGDLRALGLEPGGVAIVHTSLSSLGWVAGGAAAVLGALLDVLGPEGTLVVPTHTGQLSDPATWGNPPVPESWWPVIREHVPAFRADETPSYHLGVLPEIVLRRRDSLRSVHPLHSFAAIGAAAPTIVAPPADPLPYSLGDPSPLGRIYDLDGQVLLLGVGHDSNTSLHLAEHRATWSGRTPGRVGAPYDDGTGRRWVEYDDLDWDETDFEQIGADFAATGAERQGPVGQGAARLMRQRAVVDFATAWITANRD